MDSGRLQLGGQRADRSADRKHRRSTSDGHAHTDSDAYGYGQPHARHCRGDRLRAARRLDELPIVGDVAGAPDLTACWASNAGEGALVYDAPQMDPMAAKAILAIARSCRAHKTTAITSSAMCLMV